MAWVLIVKGVLLDLAGSVGDFHDWPTHESPCYEVFICAPGNTGALFFVSSFVFYVGLTCLEGMYPVFGVGGKKVFLGVRVNFCICQQLSVL